MRILLEKGLVLTLDEDNRILDDTDVHIDGDRVVNIAQNIRNSNMHAFDRIIDAKGKLIMPGLVNAHFHSYDAFMKGLYEDLPLEIWGLYVDLNQHRPYSENELYVRTLLVMSEMIRNGITSIHDNVTLAPLSINSINTIMDAYKQSGIRAYVGTSIKNQTRNHSLPRQQDSLNRKAVDDSEQSAILDIDETLEILRWMIFKWNGVENRLFVSLAPSAPQRCTDGFLIELDSISSEYQIPISTHVLETRVQVITGLQLYGKSIVQHLEDIGFLSDRLSIHHGVWLNHHDIELLAEHLVSVVHNPVSNLRLGSGLTPIKELLKSGVNVALGCDNFSANDSQNIFEAMKFAALLPEVSDPSFSIWKPAKEALHMATKGGAKSLLANDRIGSIGIGKQADIIILNLSTPAFSPLNNIINQLVYCETGRSVETVLVNGHILMENKKLLTFDEQAVLVEAKAIGRKRLNDQDAITQAISSKRAYIERRYWESQHQKIDINRFSSNLLMNE